MKRYSRIFIGAWIVLALALPCASLAEDYANKGAALASQGSVTMENSFIRLVVSIEGTMNLGTTGGNPDFDGDENKALLFGYPNPRRTSFASVKVIAGGDTVEHRLGHSLLPTYGPVREGDAIVTGWEIDGVNVTQYLSFFENPYSGNKDMVLMR